MDDDQYLFDRQLFAEAEARKLGPVRCPTEESNLPESWWKTLWSTKPPMCPDCRKGYLCEGPSGGANTNYTCDYCDAKVNLCIPVEWGQRLYYGWTHRLPKSPPPEVEEPTCDTCSVYDGEDYVSDRVYTCGIESGPCSHSCACHGELPWWRRLLKIFGQAWKERS